MKSPQLRSPEENDERNQPFGECYIFIFYDVSLWDVAFHDIVYLSRISESFFQVLIILDFYRWNDAMGLDFFD